MCYLSSPHSKNYNDVFRPLISLHQQFNILALIDDEIGRNAPDDASPSWSFSRFFPRRPQPPSPAEQNEMVIKLFRRKIKNWTETLDAELEAARYYPEWLKPLKDVIHKIWSENKMMMLREKLEELNFLSPKVEKALKRLEEMVMRTLGTIPLEKLTRPSGRSHNFASCYGGWSPFGLAGFRLPFYSFPASYPAALPSTRKVNSEPEFRESGADQQEEVPEEERSVDPKALQEEMARESRSLLQQQRANEISRYRPFWGPGWEDKLLAEFNQINEESSLIALAEKLEPIQALAIINRTIHNQQHEWKLIYLLGSIGHTTFIEVLNAFDVNLLTFTNQALRCSPKDALDWFEQAFLKHRVEIINTCNNIRNKIDALAKRFREDLKGHKLTEGDLTHITELRDNITLRMSGIKEKLIPLIEGVIKHPETKAALSNEAIKEYKSLLKRLSLKREEENDPAGCLMPIIYRNVFERTDLEDTEEAYEILADWSICNREDYCETGLLGNIDIETFRRLFKDLNVFTLSKENLGKLGIKTIFDWKRLDIFNRTMLRNFLKKEENQRQLTQWTKEVMANPPPRLRLS
ncbi:MAG: hypothetical protein ACE5GN_05855 [Waddliaceae bacterium]